MDLSAAGRRDVLVRERLRGVRSLIILIALLLFIPPMPVDVLTKRLQSYAEPVD